MADDNILRIGAEFNVAPIIAGANEAGNAIEGLRAKTETYNGASTEEMAALDGVARAAQAVQTTSTTSTRALTTEADALDAVGRAAAAVAPQLEKVNEVQGVTAIQARLTTDALTGNFARAENALVRFASHSEALAPIMQALFVPFALGIFADLLITAGERLYHVYENVVLLKGAIKALDEAAESEAEHAAGLNESYEESVARRLEAEGKLTEAAEAYKKASADKPLEIPKIDDKNFKQFSEDFVTFTKAVHATSEAPEVIKRIGAEADSTAEQLKKAKADLDSFSEISGEALAYGGTTALTHAQALVDDLTKKLALLQTMQGQIQSQTGISSNKLADDQARLDKKEDKGGKADEYKEQADARRAAQEAELSFAESVFKREYEAHHISLQDELTDLRTIETARIEIKRKAFDEEESGLKKNRKPGDHTDEKLDILNSKREEAETQHTQKMADIDGTGAAEQFKTDQERALRAIEINKQVMQSDDELARHRAEVALKKADTPDEIAGGSAAVIAATNQAIENQIAAIEKENAVLAKDPSEAAQAKIAENLRKVHELKNQETKEDEDAAQEAADRIEGYYRDQLSMARSTAEESMRAVEDSARQQTEAVRNQFETHEINAAEYLASVKEIASQEFIAQSQFLAAELQNVENLYAAQLISYKEYASQKAEIDKQISEASRRMWGEIDSASQAATKRQEEDIKRLSEEWGNDWARMANEVITHKEKIGTAVVQMMGEIELQMIDNGIKKIVANYAQDLLQILAAHTTFITTYLAAHANFLLVLLGLETANQAKKKVVLSAGDAAKLAEETLMKTKEVALVASSETAQTAAITTAQTAQSAAITTGETAKTAAITTAQAVQTASLSTGKAAQVGINAAASAAEISQDAGVAGAAGFASAMVALPFPINIAVAPGVAAAAAAETLSNLVFVAAGAEKGAIVPEDMPINLHAQEMVLPAPISKSLQGAVPAIQNFNATMEGSKSDSLSSIVNQSNRSESTTNQGSKRTHVEVNFNGGSGNLKHDDIIKSVRQGIRRGELRMP